MHAPYIIIIVWLHLSVFQGEIAGLLLITFICTSQFSSQEKRGLVFTGRYFLGYDIFGTPWIICPWIFNPITASFGLMTPKYAFYSRMRGGRGNLTNLTKLAYQVVLCIPDSGSDADASFL